MRLLLERFAAPMAELMLISDEEGALRGLEFADHESRILRLLQRYYGEVVLEEGAAPKGVTRALEKYFAGDLEALESVRVGMGGTAFQREVWGGLRRIPAGRTLSYGELAEKIGRVGASRAVGAANGSNPVAIVVPCHRVIGADGSLTGFGSGLPRKEWLLGHERKFVRAGLDEGFALTSV